MEPLLVVPNWNRNWTTKPLHNFAANWNSNASHRPTVRPLLLVPTLNLNWTTKPLPNSAANFEATSSEWPTTSVTAQEKEGDTWKKQVDGLSRYDRRL